MTVLLLVEGKSDRDTLPILARKLLTTNVSVRALSVGQGDLLSADKITVHIRFAVARQRDIETVLLCIDSECTEILKTRRRIEAVAQAVSNQITGLTVRASVVDHSLEGWLLNDRRAVAQFLGTSPGALRYSNPENTSRPAVAMRRLFSKHGRDFVKTGDLPRLAGTVDPARIEAGSPTFKEFRLALE